MREETPRAERIRRTRSAGDIEESPAALLADQNKVFIYLSDTFKKMFSRGKNNSNLNFNTIVIAFEQSSEINEDDWQGFITTIKSIIKKQNDRTSKKLFKDIQTDI